MNRLKIIEELGFKNYDNSIQSMEGEFITYTIKLSGFFNELSKEEIEYMIRGDE